MIVTDRFVYIHLHKSGGTFVNEALLRFVPGAQVIGYHLPRRCLPEEYRHLPVLGFVRNPWSYYVSWYSFQRGLAAPNHLFRCVSDEGRLGFVESIRNLVMLGTNGQLLDRVIEGLPAAFTNQGLNLPGWALSPLRNSGVGFYSFLYRHMYSGPDSSLFLGRMESLRDDILEFWRAIRFEPSTDLRSFLANAGDSNASAHAHYSTYYDDALRDLIAERDADLIQAFGYRFEQGARAA
jgi:hypothetical protein